MYIHHTLIAWAQFLWSRPQTTSHMVLVRPGGDQKIVHVREPKQGPHGTGPTRRQSTCVKDCARAEMDQEQSKRDRARERRRKGERVWQIPTRYFAHFLKLSDDCFAIFTAISHPQLLAPTRYTWLQRISTCIFSDILRMRIPSIVKIDQSLVEYWVNVYDVADGSHVSIKNQNHSSH